MTLLNVVIPSEARNLALNKELARFLAAYGSSE
jgi:hypothetical protein